MGTSQPQNVLEIADLHLEFDTPQGVKSALNGISLKVDEGDIVGIVGESGSGKTATVLSVLKLLPKNSARITGGRIFFLGRDILAASEQEMRKLRGSDVAMIFQEPMTALNPVRRIRNQIFEVIARHQDIVEPDIESLALNLLGDMHIADPIRILNAYPHELSGGLRQRVLIAMAFASNPKLILADEPATALDVMVQAQILNLLKQQARDRGISVIFISHDLAVVAQLCDRVYVMYRGQIVETGDTRSVIDAPRHFYTRALLNALPDGKPHKSRLVTISDTLDQEKIQSVDVDRPRQTTPQPRTDMPIRRNPLLSLEGARLHYPMRINTFGRTTHFHAAVDGVDLEIYEGETLSIVGQSGSGKTSVAKLIVGLEMPTAGTVLFGGARVSDRREPWMRRNIQMVFQDPNSSLNPRLRVWRILSEPLTLDRRIPRQQLRDQVAELLVQVGLEAGHMDRFPHEFSGGERQRIAIGRALATRPKLLVLDEPTSALDLSVQAQILNLLLDLQEQQNLTYLFISHDVAVVRHMSDRVAVMADGKIVEHGATQDVLDRPKQDYTQKLIEAVPSLKRKLN